MMKKTKPYTTGDVVSDFTLSDTQELAVTLSAQPTALVAVILYRGAW